ncbi:MAG: mannose-1-phosphate guanylyltransferase [Oligoflexus sp.]
MRAFEDHVYAVILAGGSGTRFWPKSRQKTPKQLCAIGDAEDTMIEITLQRLNGLIPPSRRIIVTHIDQIDLTKQIVGDQCEHFLAEPEARNTANALALASLDIAARHQGDKEPIMISLHADHVIQKESAFRQALAAAVTTAESGYLTLLGIVPGYPETGYGYIEQGEDLDSGIHSFKVASFREKPDRRMATEYVESGRFLWNAGIFIWKNDVLLHELSERLPNTMRDLKDLLTSNNAQDKGFNNIPFPALQETYHNLTKISIDHAILELSSNVACVSADIGWQDVGSWDALSKCFEQDEDGNLFYGDVIALDTENSTVDTDQFLVATVGLKDMIVVCAKKAILVCPKDRAQDVKEVVAFLKQSGREDFI